MERFLKLSVSLIQKKFYFKILIRTQKSKYPLGIWGTQNGETPPNLNTQFIKSKADYNKGNNGI